MSKMSQTCNEKWVQWASQIGPSYCGCRAKFRLPPFHYKGSICDAYCTHFVGDPFLSCISCISCMSSMCNFRNFGQAF